MRSLSPSRTFTCTRTVSPDFIAGRPASCDCSTSSMAPISTPPAAPSGPLCDTLTGTSLVRPSATGLLGPALFLVLRDELAQNRFFLVVQSRVRQQIRPLRERSRDRLALAPPPDLGMVPR